MSNEKLSWEQIRNQFDGNWVLLTEFGWPEGQPNPDWGVVHLADPNRREFYRRALDERDTLPSEIAILLVRKVVQQVQTNQMSAGYAWVE